MWTVLLIAFAFTGGKVESTSQECDAMLVACHDMYPETRLTAVDKAPDEAELETLCPVLVKMSGCFEDYVKECTEFDRYPLFPFYRQDGRFYKEICDKNSVLRPKYLTNVNCYKRIEKKNLAIGSNLLEHSLFLSEYLTNVNCYKRIEKKNLYTQCYKEASEFYNQYVHNKSVSEPERVLFGHCKRMPYVLGCEALDVQNSCGDTALETFLEMEKLKDSTNEIKFCLRNSEQKNEIYNDFLPSLKISENLRGKINKVLDAMEVEVAAYPDY
ncbi:uncharacterized protein LOC129984520 isoform X1 [Argiope bruennichi]|uniref:uncharacterized protein LOC129984520 isoform X1 n=1 Tax=Argiope bruennichi TaxID=94029 RepID=UPI0024952DDC|nr:uncharacterized protein LOC129984520 isoform X1 [Argiope bruennichi]